DWWAEAPGWKKIFEADEEIVPVPGPTRPKRHLGGRPGSGSDRRRVRCGGRGKAIKNRLHLDLAAQDRQWRRRGAEAEAIPRARDRVSSTGRGLSRCRSRRLVLDQLAVVGAL